MLNAHQDLLAKAEKILLRMHHAHPDRVLAVLQTLTSSLSARAQKTASSWNSDITDDGTPFEFSLGFKTGSTNFRILWEAQSADPSPDSQSQWLTATAVHELVKTYDSVSLESFEAIKDLFTPQKRSALRFSLWHALDFDSQGNFLLKAYLNPLAQTDSKTTVLTALKRLKQDSLATHVLEFIKSRPTDEILYFSVDLSESTASRAKVYVAHPNVTGAELDKMLAVIPTYKRDEASQFLSQMSQSPGSFRHRPLITCLSQKASETHPSLTLHFPIRSYVNSDAEILARLPGILETEQISLLNDVLDSDLDMKPTLGRGGISYVSRKLGTPEARTSVYIQSHYFKPYAKT